LSLTSANDASSFPLMGRLRHSYVPRRTIKPLTRNPASDGCICYKFHWRFGECEFLRRFRNLVRTAKRESVGHFVVPLMWAVEATNVKTQGGSIETVQAEIPPAFDPLVYSGVTAPTIFVRAYDQLDDVSRGSMNRKKCASKRMYTKGLQRQFLHDGLYNIPRMCQIVPFVG
jgi:hypothetical protein